MKKFLAVSFFVTLVLLMLAWVKFYIFFIPRQYDVCIFFDEVPVYAETWQLYTPLNNLIGSIHNGTITISTDAGQHSDDVGFVKIMTCDGKSGYVQHYLAMRFSTIIYENKLMWYFLDQLEWKGLMK